VQIAFKKLDNPDMKGYVVFLPMLRSDNKESAEAEADVSHADARISRWWNGRKDIGKAYSKTLGLHGTAWDVYLVYGPGKTWEGKVPPYPDFWMHQLRKRSGADQSLFLNQGIFEERLSQMVNHAAKPLKSKEKS